MEYQVIRGDSRLLGLEEAQSLVFGSLPRSQSDTLRAASTCSYPNHMHLFYEFRHKARDRDAAWSRSSFRITPAPNQALRSKRSKINTWPHWLSVQVLTALQDLARTLQDLARKFRKSAPDTLYSLSQSSTAGKLNTVGSYVLLTADTAVNSRLYIHAILCLLHCSMYLPSGVDHQFLCLV